MITAVFSKANGNYVGFKISGHSGLSEAGSDILCAAVSGATELAANAIGGKTSVDEKTASVTVSIPRPDESSQRIVSALIRQLKGYSEDYPKHIRIEEQENVL